MKRPRPTKPGLPISTIKATPQTTHITMKGSIVYSVITFAFSASTAHGFFNFFHHEQQQQPQEMPYEELVLNSDCREYVCPATKQCVKAPIDCDCPFPSSQLKCVLPDNKNYICISKPAIVDNEKLQQVYDDPVLGPKAHNKGVRDCGWVVDAWNGVQV